ncbi:MAG: response regulator [Ilumatobacteraceae bacterium]
MSTTAALRVIIADDHPLYREGVATCFARESDIEVVGHAASGREAERVAREHPAEVVLLDLSMPDGGGVPCVERVVATPCSPRVLVVTASDDAADVTGCFRAGAAGYVLKGASGRELAAAVRTVAAGRAYLSPALGAALLGPAVQTERERFTSREADVIRLLATGMTNREIGEQLYLAEKTVKHHITHLFQKLGARNRLEAVLLAQRSGLLDNG